MCSSDLNPLFTVGFQVCEVLRGHLGLSAADARAKAVALFDEVGIPEPERRFDEYPHVLSGGMRQRVMIAMAIACQPRLLIADEPTTALDVTIQAQILELMLALRERHRSSILLITHDMGVIARMADRVVVMYAGQVAEVAPLRALFEGPAHPYAKLLLGAMPSARRKLASLPVIPGAMPSPAALPGGCRFHPRCPYAVAQCRTEPPPMTAIAPGRAARCWRAGEVLHGLAA